MKVLKFFFLRTREVARLLSIVPLYSREAGRDWKRLRKSGVPARLLLPAVWKVWPVWRAGSWGCCRCVLLSAHARQSSFGSLSFSWGFCPERKEMRQWEHEESLFPDSYSWAFLQYEDSPESTKRMWSHLRPQFAQVSTAFRFNVNFVQFWVYCGSLECGPVRLRAAALTEMVASWSFPKRLQENSWKSFLFRRWPCFPWLWVSFRQRIFRLKCDEMEFHSSRYIMTFAGQMWSKVYL